MTLISSEETTVNSEVFRSNIQFPQNNHQETQVNSEETAVTSEFNTQREEKEREEKKKKEKRIFREKSETDLSLSENGHQELIKSEQLMKIFKKKNKKGGDPLFSDFVDIYFEWMKSEKGFPPQFDGSDGKALKSILKYFRSISQDDKQVLEAWSAIFSNYEKWDNFHKTQLRLRQINSNLTNIINSIKNGNPSKNLTAGKSITEIRSEIGDLD